MSPRPARPPALALAALAALGCGYQLAAGAGRLPAGAQRVFVRQFEDRTVDAELGALVATSLRRELARRGAEGGPDAPARLEGAVTQALFAPTSVTGTYRVTLRVEARLWVDGRVEAERAVERGEDVLSGLDPLETEGRRRIALRRAAEEAARELLEDFEGP